MTFAFAAAGTGGHIYPALAVARVLVSSGVPPSDIVFFGGDRLETRIVPETGFELVQLEVRGLKRSLTTDNLMLPVMVRRATAAVADVLGERDSGVLTVFGGYVSVPAALGARKVGMPYVIHEQNAVPGLANRYVARGAARTLAAFAPALDRLKSAEIVGNPLGIAFENYERDEIRAEAFRRYGLASDLPVVGVSGGSQGARALNDSAAELAAAFGETVSVLHITGPDHHDAVAEQARSTSNWVTVPFESDMQFFFAASDVVLSRAGAMTVSELAVTSTPSVVVPLPAGKGYQALNARDLERAGGSLVVDQERITEVPALLVSLATDVERLSAMRIGARSVAKPDAAHHVAAILEEVTRV
ncbi:MAG: UDP-N-acetylglucosamine--N-acetylmuramyl-(pentapeptide) pyrophosphoryl-undecaprenol N-acetylglucosamine transferase [Actinomycetota bacterium]|nr:UDP-N-acetylglucosamine--N-acetylmuramyl-(pentapeptide) pyrophosphoryl-undecaprenol N-acetylglucosamine transferase [Actinomycetota bacterium]